MIDMYGGVHLDTHSRDSCEREHESTHTKAYKNVDSYMINFILRSGIN